ncbi:MAG: roadblock/LC7 domain-containing protein [Gemmatimonadales bacterium]|jgi:predicted regulator of Ras-like GTPase activity (Roadblock/LC7/MglB family)|nr:roadblock/LC7 domain-containing protein [Gemmatimonadales bacterium]
MECTTMTGLGEVVQSLAARDGVEGVLLLSADGLPIERSREGTFESETVAALAATLARHADPLGQGSGRGELRTAVLEYSGGLAVLARVGGGDWLAILTEHGADVGPLLYDLRHHRPALTALL